MAYGQITFTSQPFIYRSYLTDNSSSNTLIGVSTESLNRRIYGMTVNSSLTANTLVWVSGSFAGGDYLPLFRTNVPKFSGNFDTATGLPVESFDLFGCHEARKVFKKKQDHEGNYYYDLPPDCALKINPQSSITVDGIMSILTFGEL